MPEGLAGRSLLLPEDSAAASYFEALSGHFNLGWAPLRGVIEGRYKAYEKPVPELYDLVADPGETRNLADTERRRLQGLRRLLPAESAWPPSRQSGVSPEVAATLKSLGYLSDSAPRVAAPGPEDDPHRLAGLTTRLHQAERAYSAGRYAEAATAAGEVLALRPTVPLAYTIKAQALLSQGQPAAALAAMEEAQAKGSASRELVAQMGLTLLELGRAGEAVERLEGAAARERDPGVRAVLGSALVAAGQAERGRALLRELVEENPGDGQAWERLSAAALQLGRPSEALEAASKAVELEPRRAWAWNNLGVALALLGRQREALPAWEKAVEADPELWDTWYNLGLQAADLGDQTRARKALATFVEKAPAKKYPAEIRRARELLSRLPR